MKGYSLNSIDASLAFGFYCRNEEEFTKLYNYLKDGELLIENWTLGLQDKLYFEEICEKNEQFLSDKLDDDYEIMNFK
jgi:hypothetical protein